MMNSRCISQKICNVHGQLKRAILLGILIPGDDCGAVPNPTNP